MFKKLRKWLDNRRQKQYAKCYLRQEYEGNAAFGMCFGLFGGDFMTDYLNYGCVECPYLSMNWAEKRLERWI